jgi:sensor domain CHASE-containing protein
MAGESRGQREPGPTCGDLESAEEKTLLLDEKPLRISSVPILPDSQS